MFSIWERWRQEVWMKAWTATAQASDCKAPDVATVWADECLKRFDERFKESD